MLRTAIMDRVAWRADSPQWLVCRVENPIGNCEMDHLADIGRNPRASAAENARTIQSLRAEIHYSDMLKFILVDDKRRAFVTQRYCFLGSVDDWIDIGKHGKLATLVRTYVKHLGKDSYVELV